MVITGPQKQEATFGVRAAGFVTFFLFLFWLVVKQQSCVSGILCLVWSYHPPPEWGLQFYRRTQRHCYVYFLSRNEDPVSRLYHHLIVFLLFLYSLPSLISNCLNLPFGTQGSSRRLNAAYILQIRNGENTADLYSRIATPQSPVQFNLGNRATMTVITSCQNRA